MCIYIYMSVCVWLINYDMHGDNFINIPSLLQYQTNMQGFLYRRGNCSAGRAVVGARKWSPEGRPTEGKT